VQRERIEMAKCTVVGVYTENYNEFIDWIEARDHHDAVTKVALRRGGTGGADVAFAAVFDGELLDASSHLGSKKDW